MKRIAILSFGLSGGGAERVASIVANSFAQSGHEVLFVAAYDKKREYELEDNIQYMYVDVKLPNGILRLLERSIRITKLVKKFKADVVYTFITNELIPLSLSKIPVIPSLRVDPKYLEHDKFRWHIRQFVYSKAKNVIFQTEDARDYFDENIRNKGVVIGNPIKDNLPYWNIENRKKVFMSACRISEQKNIPMLINAFVRFHEKHREYILELYGDGEPQEYKTKMEDYAKKKHAENYIFFKGHSTDIHSIMSTATAFVLASNFEGLSNSMLEAMAIGVPCICTDCPPGGARAYIEHGVSGLLVPVGGEDELYEAMCNIAESDDLSNMLSENSKYVRSELSRDMICKKWEALM